MNRLSKTLLTVLLPGLAILGPAAAEDLPTMGTAFSSDIFKDVRLADIRASTKVWVDSFGAENNVFRSGEVHILKDSDAWCTAAAKKSFTLAIMDTIDFLELEQEGFLDPCYVFKDFRGIGSEVLLLVHQDSGISSVDDLAGKDLLLVRDAYAKISRMWMNTLLSDKGLPANEDFFGSVTEKSKISNAVLPVFFKQSGACVVSRGSFETMKELNPQVGKKLTVLAQSPNYLSAVVCLLRDGDPELEAGLHSAVNTIHETAYGKQILMTFRVERFVPYNRDYMQTIRSLVEKQAQAHSRDTLPQTATAKTIIKR